jgi:hypothetical protein
MADARQRDIDLIRITGASASRCFGAKRPLEPTRFSGHLDSRR